MAQIAALNKGFLNVKAYAAKGNCKMPDTKAIDNAITAAAAAGGRTVYFPPGIYLSTSIELKSNITLYLAAGSVIENSMLTYRRKWPATRGLAGNGCKI